jgi:hypothetical protein
VALELKALLMSLPEAALSAVEWAVSAMALN